MAKDGNDGRKGRQENLSNGRSHKRNKRRLPTKASKAMLKLGKQPAFEQTTSLKLKDAFGNKVKERLDMVKSISICNKTYFTIKTAGGRLSSKQ